MFYEILQDIMNERNLSIPEVARLTGLSDSTIRSIITRKSKTVALDVAFKLSKGLDVPIERLSGLTEDKVKSNEAIDVERLIARNGKEMSIEQKMRLIQLLSEYVAEDKGK